MKVLLFGTALAVDWVMDFVERAAATVEYARKPQLVPVQGAPTRELLASLLADPIDALILADHAPFASALPAALSPDAVRAEVQRAVLAIELSRRAIDTLVLRRHEVETWPASLARLLGELATPPLPNVAGWPAWSEIAEPAAALMPSPLPLSFLQPLFAAPGQSTPLRLAWPRESFLYGDMPGEMLPATIEVAGRARIVVYGPYLPLPSGTWLATAFLGFSPDIGKLPFILEADSGGAISRGFFEVEHGGIFSVRLEFQVADALHPVELRLISQDSALEGQLSLIEVELETS